MGQYTSYYLYQKYEIRGGQEAVPVYPSVLSISGDSETTMPLVIKSENDTACGYNPYTPIYRWVNMDITKGYVCDTCPAIKFYATYNDGTTYYKECDSSTELTTATTKAHSTPYSAMKEAVIGDCVTEIGYEAFYWCGSLSSITIPSSVTSIGDRAFDFCSSLSSITIPNSVTYIGDYIFEGCTMLATVILPNNIERIGYNAFWDCRSLSAITIPYSVKDIGDLAFDSCESLTSITIPSGVTSIGGGAFEYCTSLTSVTVEAITPPEIGSDVFDGTSSDLVIYVPCESVAAYRTASGWSEYADRIHGIPPCEEPQYRTTSGTPYCIEYDKYVDVYSQVSYDGGSTWQTTATTATLVEADSEDCGYVPPTPTFDGKFRASYSDGTSYSAACDSSTELTTATTKAHTTSDTAMTHAEVGDCVTSIGYEAFYHCTSLYSVTLGNSITNFRDKAFFYCTALTSVTIEAATPPRLGENVFYGAKLTSIYVPCSSVGLYKKGADYSFLKPWRDYASIIFGIETCDGSMFKATYSDGSEYNVDCDGTNYLTSAITKTHTTSYEYMTSAEVGDCVTMIGNSAFTSCSGLASITIGNSVTYIGHNAFTYCYKLSSLTIKATTPPTLYATSLPSPSSPKLTYIYVPSESVEAYKTAEEWRAYASIIQAIPNS